MKIFFFQKILTEPEPLQNSFSTFVCLRTAFALNLVHFHPVCRWIVFHIMVWQSLAEYYGLIESESRFSGLFPASLLVSTVTVCSYHYSYTGNYIPSRSWFFFSRKQPRQSKFLLKTVSFIEFQSHCHAQLRHGTFCLQRSHWWKKLLTQVPEWYKLLRHLRSQTTDETRQQRKLEQNNCFENKQ